MENQAPFMLASNGRPALTVIFLLSLDDGLNHFPGAGASLPKIENVRYLQPYGKAAQGIYG